MQAIKEKVRNVASSAKAQSEVRKAEAEEKKDNARCEMEKGVAAERRLAKEAEAKMHLHLARADHKADRVNATFRSEPASDHKLERANATYSHELGTHDPGSAQTLAAGDQLLATHNRHGHRNNDSVAPVDITTMEPKYL